MKNACLMEMRPIRPRRDIEGENARKHERDRMRLESWQRQSKYYDKCNNENAKFEQFTSPRYYEDNTRQGEELLKQRLKEEQTIKRREKLQQLFTEDQKTYDIEIMMENCTPRSWHDDPVIHKENETPIELLKNVNNGIKLDEEERRRNQAENALYERWKRDDKHLIENRRLHNMKDIKMSWLDQQIEKRMAREKEEKELQEQIKHMKLLIDEQKKQEEVIQREAARKEKDLQLCLKQQKADVLKREEETKLLDQQEYEIQLKRSQLQELEDKWEETERQRRTEEVALENQHFHRRKMQLKAQKVLEDLESDRKFIEELKHADLCEKVLNEAKRFELQRSMNEFHTLVRDLKSVELKRKNNMQFTFDSEVPAVLRQFDHSWKMEEEMRRKLMRNILSDLKEQINENLKSAKLEQEEKRREREEMMQRIEEDRAEIQTIKDWERNKMAEYKKSLQDQMSSKRKKERDLKKLDEDKHREELEQLNNEEVRLKNEIMKMQKGHAVPTYGRRQFFY